MKSPLRFVCATVAAALSLAPMPGFAACIAHSGPRTAALVELYTSEGCSSCPPADAELRRLREVVDPAAEVVPIALHVDYWDSIGWKDPYAKPAFADRQKWLVGMNDASTVYTPHFFIAGTELIDWRQGLRQDIGRLNARPAAAQISLKASLTGDLISIDVEADARNVGDATLFLAVAENALVSSVTRGENSGATLTHDHVVRQWIGPLPFAGGKAHAERDVRVPAAWNRAQLEIVAFVQDAKSGKVLQAVAGKQCTAM